MKKIRLLLLPFSLIYGAVTWLRNVLFDRGVYKQASFSLPVVAVGNLSTGGTGKTPQTEYLIRLLSPLYNTAVLSRGYGRKTTGYILAGGNDNAQTLGDEPYQFFSKFGDKVRIAVDANRVEGITNLMSLSPKPQVILLDDAYQHRKVKAGLYVLLTAYNDLYTDDFILPAGNLREGRAGAGRAAVIVVTKCPPDISTTERADIVSKLKPYQEQQVYFTCIAYDNAVYSVGDAKEVAAVINIPKVLVAGIAKPKPFFERLKQDGDVIKQYPDHHDFTDAEIQELNQLSENRIIIATEKDFVRLKGRLPENRLYYLPIRTAFVEGGADFDKTILNYVEQSTGNR